MMENVQILIILFSRCEWAQWSHGSPFQQCHFFWGITSQLSRSSDAVARPCCWKGGRHSNWNLSSSIFTYPSWSASFLIVFLAFWSIFLPLPPRPSAEANLESPVIMWARQRTFAGHIQPLFPLFPMAFRIATPALMFVWCFVDIEGVSVVWRWFRISHELIPPYLSHVLILFGSLCLWWLCQHCVALTLLAHLSADGLGH